MKFFIKQKVITWRDSFQILDEKKKPVYKVKGELVSIGHKLHIYDMKGKEVATIKEKIIKVMPKYQILTEKKKEFWVTKKITLVNEKFKVEPVDWLIDGGILEHNYSIKNGKKTIAKVHQKWISIGDSYIIDIEDEKVDPIVVLATMICVDCVEFDRKEKEEKEKKARKGNDR
ncbi:MAG: LURP-one-related family protein [Lachnospiraceae bacterium]|nr:LURP-one-related family protein [Lachnospiraceae bacterium]